MTTPTTSPAAPASARSLRLGAILAAVMIGTSVLGSALKPHRLLADTRAPVRLQQLLPERFGDWTPVPMAQGVINPQARTLQDQLYAELVNRVYRNPQGEMVMLSVAYGRNQSDAFQVHKPEICYPAQGFQVQRIRADELRSAQGAVPVRRLETVYGATRFEPVTYWTTLGDHAVRSSTDKKLMEMRYALKGYIADGLLFRVSSLERDSVRAFALQDRFAREMLAAMTPEARQRIAGLP
ncbi:MAG: EpsI family protein [Pseudomonadota bacterium]|jgi:EpsI family protein|nr:hypothetical protein [Pseudomonadota bacterium]